ncbi:MAG: hypothetical protein AAFR38_03725 [Planctomycetota bacterium]
MRLILSVFAIGAVVSAANAQRLRIQQEFRSRFFQTDGEILFVDARVDTSGMTGVGEEDFLASRVTVLYEKFGNGQSFNETRMPPVCTLTTPECVRVRFTNGQNPALGTIGVPGGNTFNILDSGFGLAVIQYGRPTLVFGGSVLFTGNYDLVPETEVITDLGPPPCSPADLAQPFGVISQADVTRFVELFFEDDPRVASLAEPFDVVSQADVDAFVTLFFQGCPE